jgi:hypothetical protein
VVHEPNVFFLRQYRSALLDYLLGSGELGRERAYELGRLAVHGSLGPLQILRVHQQALRSILETERPENGLRRLKASQEFLMESLSPFEMAYRGYVDLLERAPDTRERREARRRPGSGQAISR